MEVTSQIHRTAVVGIDVEIGSGVIVGPHAVITGPCRIGATTVIGAGAHIGGHGEHIHYPKSHGRIEIGAGCRISDGVTIHRALNPGETTSIGDYCMLLAGCYVAHNCELLSHVIVASGARLAGYVRVGQGAFIGMNAAVHQHTVIGGGSLVGMGAACIEHVPCLSKQAGVPAHYIGPNEPRHAGKAREEDLWSWFYKAREESDRI